MSSPALKHNLQNEIFNSHSTFVPTICLLYAGSGSLSFQIDTKSIEAHSPTPLLSEVLLYGWQMCRTVVESYHAFKTSEDRDLGWLHLGVWIGACFAWIVFARKSSPRQAIIIVRTSVYDVVVIVKINNTIDVVG